MYTQAQKKKHFFFHLATSEKETDFVILQRLVFCRLRNVNTLVRFLCVSALLFFVLSPKGY